MTSLRVGLAAVSALLIARGAAGGAGDGGPVGWPTTEGDPGGMRYSPLREIDRSNVSRLVPVWTFEHGDYQDGGWLEILGPERVLKGTNFQATPVLVGESLVFSTPFDRVIALDAATGGELWRFDPRIPRSGLTDLYPNGFVSRGVAVWTDSRAGPLAGCRTRIFLGTLDARLIAIDAATGLACPEFADAGELDLREGIDAGFDTHEYGVTSPPTVVGDLVVVGSSIADMVRRRPADGSVRAFDARTGERVWTFHTIPEEGELGVETWEHESWRTNGAANVWSTATADLERGMIFLPVSSPAPDNYGADRPGANLFGNSVVAADAASGRRIWHFQVVHHDLWDYDLASPPKLVTLNRPGGSVDAIVQLTKQGFVFLIDRETGVPLFPVEERPVPVSDVPGERAWPTQPFPTKPPPLVPIGPIEESELSRNDPERFGACRVLLHRYRNEGIYTPPSIEGSLYRPTPIGGANWSGGAFDPERGLLFVPVNINAHRIKLMPLPADNYPTHRAVFDSWLSALWFYFGGFRGTGLRYIPDDTPFTANDARTLRRGFDLEEAHCLAPPWGELVAVDLVAGEIRWHAPIGERNGVRGLYNLGPPLATGGGLVFQAGSADPRLRAYDAETGEVLATLDLPAGLHAGPITYRLRPGGRQYLVVAPGGSTRLQSPLGGYVIAYALPD